MTTFHVAGIPAPQGGKSGYIRGGHVVLVESSKKVKPWRAAVAQATTIAYLRTEPIETPSLWRSTSTFPARRASRSG